MIATTISSSISVKPFWFLIVRLVSFHCLSGPEHSKARACMLQP